MSPRSLQKSEVMTILLKLSSKKNKKYSKMSLFLMRENGLFLEKQMRAYVAREESAPLLREAPACP